jgi:iron complex transport system substrate-binding protein
MAGLPATAVSLWIAAALGATAITAADTAGAAAALAAADVAGAAVAAVPGSAAALPARIVSLAPSVTETLFALGEGSAVVGVSQYCDYPPAATHLPRVGTFLTPNVEAIAALRPTLIIGPGLSSNRRQVRALEAMGYATMTVDDDSLAGIMRSIELVGARTGRAEAAHRLLASINARIGAVRARLKGVKPRTVVMLVGHQPTVAVGRGTYLDDLLRLAGADNIAELAPQSWPHLSLEYIIAMRPEVILDGQMGSDASTPAGFWSRYPTIPAVRDHRVFGYPEDPVLHPGPRVGETLEILARLIHPERFAATGALQPSTVRKDDR